MAAGRPDLERYAGRKLTVVAWLWARTVKSPNPAFAHVDVPLASTFMLSTKKGKEAWVEPVVEGDGYRFTVKAGLLGTGVPKDGAPGNAGVRGRTARPATDRRSGAEGPLDPANAGVPEDGNPGSTGVPPAQASRRGPLGNGVSREDTGVSEGGNPGSAGIPPPPSSFPRKRESMRPGNGSPGNAGGPPAQGTKLGRGANFRCLMSDAPIPGDYIKAEGKAGRMGARLMAIVAEGDRGRVYLAPTLEHEERARGGGSGVVARQRRSSEAHRRNLRALWLDDLGRPVHPPPACRTDHLLRPGDGSNRSHQAGRPGNACVSPASCSSRRDAHVPGTHGFPLSRE